MHPAYWVSIGLGIFASLSFIGLGILRICPWNARLRGQRTIQTRSEDELATILEELRNQANEISLTAPNSNRPAMVISMAVQQLNC